MTHSVPSITHSRREGDASATVLARRFGDVLRVGDGQAAETVIDEALASGMDPPMVQSMVIAPAMVRIGEMWETGVIGVADEHLATSISQRALLRLFERLSADRLRVEPRERILLAAVEGQHHVLGLRMIGDVLEGAGFEVLYLGQDVPVESLGAFAAQHHPAVTGLAFGFDLDVGRLLDSLWTLHTVVPETRIMLGGSGIPPEILAVYPCIENSMGVLTAVEDLLSAPPQELPEVVERLRSEGVGTLDSLDAGESDAIAESMAKANEGAVEVAREQIRRAEKYRDLAFRDPLTDLANRRAFDDEISTLQRQSEVSGSLIMIDVDSFKAVNDDLGHEAGDKLLRAIGHSIKASIRPTDLAARIGGDEFAVLLRGATTEVAQVTAERIRKAVAEDSDPPVSVSVGVSMLSSDSRGSLLTADLALYRAKAAGRDRVFTTELALEDLEDVGS